MYTVKVDVGGLPDHYEIGRMWFVAEERRSNKVIIESWNGLTRIDVTELHER